MQRAVRVLTMVVLLLAAASAQAEPASPGLEKEIVGLTQQLMDALAPGKADVWQRLLADDALITDEFGRRQTKKEAVDGVRGLPPGFSGKIELRDPRVHVYGDAAVIECEWHETESVFEQKLLVRYIATTTFVRRDGQWRVVAMMDVTLPTPPPALALPNLLLKDYPATYRYGPERAWTVAIEGGKLVYRTKPERPPVTLDPVGSDVFMSGDDEKNLILFRRDASGKVTEIIERRKFNDLHLRRE